MKKISLSLKNEAEKMFSLLDLQTGSDLEPLEAEKKLLDDSKELSDIYFDLIRNKYSDQIKNVESVDGSVDGTITYEFADGSLLELNNPGAIFYEFFVNVY